MFLHLLLITIPRQSRPADSLVGEWNGLIASKALPNEKARREFNRMVHWHLILKPDGTFQWRFVDHVMINIDERAGGKYRIIGSKVSLSGWHSGFMDDGYKKEKLPGGFSQTLTVTNGQLSMNAESGATTIFTRSAKLPAGSAVKKIAKRR